jgi:phage gp16-like protein
MTTITRTDPRARLIRLIHVAKRDLAMEDDAYRLLLTRCAGKNSTSAMGVMELEKVLHHMKHAGFRVRIKESAGASRLSRPLSGAARANPGEAAKIRALWLFMHHQLRLVRDPSEAALASYVKRITGVEALQWLDGRQAYRVIESLKKWAERVFLECLVGRASRLVDRFRMSRPDADLIREVRDRLERAYESVGRNGKPGAYDACLAAWESLDELARAEPGPAAPPDTRSP